MQTRRDQKAWAVTADSPCIGHCTTVLGDDVCRSCLRTFEEITSWPTITDEERTRINQRIADLTLALTQRPSGK